MLHLISSDCNLPVPSRAFRALCAQISKAFKLGGRKLRLIVERVPGPGLHLVQEGGTDMYGSTLFLELSTPVQRCKLGEVKL